MIHYLLIKEIFMLLSLISSTILGIILVDYQDLKDELKENIEYYGEDEKTTFKNKLLFKKIKKYKKIIVVLVIIFITSFTLFLLWR